jgi:hypothetical protein
VGERNDASDDFYLCIQWPTTLYLIHAPEINFWSTFFLGYYRDNPLVIYIKPWGYPYESISSGHIQTPPQSSLALS